MKKVADQVQRRVDGSFEFSFGHWTLHYNPTGEDMIFVLYENENDELVDWWTTGMAALMDIQYSPVGDAITEDEWKQLWDWIHNKRICDGRF